MALDPETHPRLAAAAQRLTAVLVFDSRMQQSLGGARDAASGSVQYVFQAGGASIDLLCDPEDRAWWITGQAVVLDSVPPGAIAGWKVITRPPAAVQAVETDELGMFVLPAVPPGDYELLLSDGQHEIVLPNVELAATY